MHSRLDGGIADAFFGFLLLCKDVPRRTVTEPPILEIGFPDRRLVAFPVVR